MAYGDSLLLDQVLNEELTRITEIADRWKLYLGEHDKPLRLKQGAVDDNVIANLVGMFIDKGVSFLAGTPPSYSLPDLRPDPKTGGDAPADESEDASPEEEHLDLVWRTSRRKTLMQKNALNGAVAGHFALRILQPADPKAPQRVITLDPSCVAIEFDQEDIDRRTAYKLQWNIVDDNGRPAVRRQMICLDESEAGWTITDYLSSRGSGFLPMGEPVRWPWPFAPIVDGQNLPMPNEVYGLSDLDGGVESLQSAVNRSLSNMQRIVRFHGHPKTWASGISTTELAKVIVDPDGVIGLPHPDAQLHNLEMSSDLKAVLDVFDRMKGLLHEVSHVPDLSTEKLDGLGQMSGLALKVLYGPLLELTQKKQGSYGDALEEANRRILAVAGLHEYDPSLDVLVGWRDPSPEDPAAEWTTAEAKQRIGVSKYTLLEEGGYDPELEAERRDVEAEASMEQMQTAFDRGGFAGPGATDGGNDPADNDKAPPRAQGGKA